MNATGDKTEEGAPVPEIAVGAHSTKMKVLVVDDDEDKLAALVSFLDETYDVGEVLSARSFQSGLRAIFDNSPGLIFLDMTMPNFDRTISDDGGRPLAFAGREILRQMKREGVKTPVLVVTHFNRFSNETHTMSLTELESELHQRFPNYVGTIQYKSNVDDWRPALVQAVGSRLKRKEGF